MTTLVLVCRSCTTLLTQPLEPVPADGWQSFTTKSLIEEGRVLQWTSVLWTHDNQYLPFTTGSWVLAPPSMIVDCMVTSAYGCCGFPPLEYGPGAARRNQLCVCGELVGWHNTDCLAPHFIALSEDKVEALPP